MVTKTPAAGHFHGMPRLYPGLFLVVAAFGCVGVVERSDGTPSASAGAPTSGAGGSGAASAPKPSLSDPCRDLPARSPLLPPVVRRLTRIEYDNSVAALLHDTSKPAQSLLADEKIEGFDLNAVNAVAPLHLEQYLDAAEAVAARAIGRMASWLPCDPARVGEAACARTFVTQFGRRAFRRPLQKTQIDAYVGLYETGRTLSPTAAEAFAHGVRVVLEAMLQSPYFLYRMEVGETAAEVPNARVLGPHALASRLAFFLWSAPPDDALLTAADSGKLATTADLEREAARMLKDPRADATWTAFHLQWLQVDNIESMDKDRKQYPSFSAALARSMKRETERFTLEMLRDAKAGLRTLLTGNFTFVDTNLAAFYGASGAPSGDAMVRQDLSRLGRAGVLTHASVLAQHAKSDQTSPVLRGKFVRERLLCQHPPPPPPGTDTTVPAIGTGLSTRERFAEHRRDPVCAGCHALMDPIGFGFEGFDAIGQRREMDAGKPLDVRGELSGTDVDGAFNGAIELAERLAGSEQVAACYVTQWARYAFAHADVEATACALKPLASLQAGGALADVRLALIKTDAFRLQGVR